MKIETGVFKSIVIAAALLLTTASQAEEPTRETRPLTGAVKSIRLHGPVDLTLTQGANQGVIVEGDAETRSRITLNVTGSELGIRYEPESKFISWSKHATPRVSLALPSLSKLGLQGSGDADIAGFDLKDDLQLEIQGSGDIRVQGLKASDVVSTIRGSGSIQIDGQAVGQAIAIEGSGDYKAGQLQSRSAVVSIKGSGDARIWATEALSIDIAGSGDVAYKGDPKLSQRVHGSGTVKRFSGN